ncbi:hypothetical protein ORI20_22175 [Mycobacterium sp. CVI_P3]|uniref:Uncharacterized protein n=1 Tax=Mycobacterium pinniadriaticum TaxID=2994102 RepID=A0ABT3SIJ0_9MYCO|nr:hypothetical protein [Mycobacterium pinniadriaticum]MCX2932982.1 hypothetical protein [Mycobacterium pinniadriaticum]MCX2939346.1 hypothetical protein [Mycobacterium pinniadriaticum]
MDRPEPRWIPAALRPWLQMRWVQAGLVIALFALLGVVFMLTSDRKDSAYWAGYADGQRWVDAGGYRAHDESIARYCAVQATHQATSYERGCIDGAHNAMH